MVALIGKEAPISGENMEPPSEDDYLADLLEIGQVKAEIQRKAKHDAEAEASRRKNSRWQ